MSSSRSVPGVLTVLLATVLSLTSMVGAAAPAHAATVEFADPALAACVAAKLNLPAGSPVDSAQAATVTTLYCDYRDVRQLGGVQNLTSLYYLSIDGSQVSDFAPLAALPSLRKLSLIDAGLTSLNPLSGLTGLRELNVTLNRGLVDVEGARPLTGLTQLIFGSTAVLDVRPLAGLPNLSRLSGASLYRQVHAAVGVPFDVPMRWVDASLPTLKLPTGLKLSSGRLVATAPGTYTVTFTKGNPNFPVEYGMDGRLVVVADRIGTAPVTLNDTTPVTDQVLTATTAAWAPAPVDLTYQWYRKSPSGRVSAVPGATATIFQVRPIDVGYRLRVKVTGTKTGYLPAARYSGYSYAVKRARFSAAPAPLISGVPRYRMTLTADPGTWTPAPGSLSYRWQRYVSGAWRSITGATKPTYVPTGSDVNRRVRVRVKGYRPGYVTVSRYSTPVRIMPGLASATPVVSDRTPTTGQVLTVAAGTWRPTPAFTYQWFSRTAAGVVTPIPGATGDSFAVPAELAGTTLRVAVAGSLADYAAVTRYSSWTYPVAPA